jgi:hypothetical protein
MTPPARDDEGPSRSTVNRALAPAGEVAAEQPYRAAGKIDGAPHQCRPGAPRALVGADVSSARKPVRRSSAGHASARSTRPSAPANTSSQGWQPSYPHRHRVADDTATTTEPAPGTA